MRIAGVLTVKSITDWKVSTGGIVSSLSSARQPLDLRLQRVGQPEGLARAVDGKRVVLERVELRQVAQPRRLGKRRQQRRQPGQPGEAGETRDADHRRGQHQSIGTRQLRVLDRVERVLHRQCTAVRESNQVQRRRCRHPASRFTHGEPRCRRPVFPAHVGQPGGDRAMAGHADADGDEAVLRVALGDVAQAVGRVRESVQQHHGAPRRRRRLDHVGAVPVVRELRREDGAALEVAVVGHALVRLELPRDVGQHAVEDRLLLLDIARPVGGVEFIGPQFDGHEGMPGLQWRPLQRAVGTNGERPRTHQQDRDQQAAEVFFHALCHGLSSYEAGCPAASSRTTAGRRCG